MLGFFKGNSNKTVILTVTNRTIIRVLILVLLSFILFAAVKKTSHSLILIFTAFFLSLALNAPVHWLAEHIPGKRRGSRSIGTFLSFLMVVILIVAFIGSVAPPLIRQTTNFIHVAPGLLQSIHNQNSGLGQFVRRYHLTGQVNTFSNQLGVRLQHLSGTAFSSITKLTGSMFSVLAILVLTFMMLIEGPHWFKVLKTQLPKDQQAHVSKVSSDMYRVIKGYVNGQVLLAFIAAVVMVIPLLSLNIGYPVALMVVVFICALIPLVGHTIGAVIITTVSLFHSPWAALFILVYYILYMQIEAYIIQPKIQANSTNMSPLLVFTAVVIGIGFDGLLGGLVAIPIAGCLKVLLVDYLDTGHHLFSRTITEDTK